MYWGSKKMTMSPQNLIINNKDHKNIDLIQSGFYRMLIKHNLAMLSNY